MSVAQTLRPSLSVRVPAERRNNAASLLAELTDIARIVIEDHTIELSPDTALEDVPGWDSMNHVSILVEVECRFGLAFSLPETELLDTVGDLLRLIQLKCPPTPS